MRFHGTADLAGRHLTSGYYGYEFTDGHRGMARAVAGAKKFIRSRRRFHDKMALRALDITEQDA